MTTLLTMPMREMLQRIRVHQIEEYMPNYKIKRRKKEILEYILRRDTLKSQDRRLGHGQP
jgi:hypothetical protein